MMTGKASYFVTLLRLQPNMLQIFNSTKDETRIEKICEPSKNNLIRSTSKIIINEISKAFVAMKKC